MNLFRYGTLGTLLFCLTVPGLAAGDKQAPPIIVFAAASLSDSLEEIGALFTERTGIPVKVNSGGSLALAQQIMKGAPADIFIPASTFALVSLNRSHIVDEASVQEWLTNSLVVVAPSDRATRLNSPEEIALGEFKRIAIGDPDIVPAGKYARQALTSLNLWERLQGRLVYAAHVRAALAYVESGEADLGIVYASDARVTPGVEIVLELPPDSHSPIRYPIALVARVGRAPGTRRLIRFLGTPEAMEIAERSGFSPAAP